MKKIALIASKGWQSKRIIKQFLDSMYNVKDEVIVLGAGGTQVGNNTIKKYAMEFGLNYQEYNPSYTGYNLYSALPEAYYGKPYHYSHLIDRINKLVDAADAVAIFCSEQDAYNKKVEPEVQAAITRAKKKEKEYTIIKVF